MPSYELARLPVQAQHAHAARVVGGDVIQRSVVSSDEHDAARNQSVSAGRQVQRAARVTKDAGEPLTRATRDYFEPRFGHDFSRVRIHANAEAQSAARGVGARAYTLGSHIVFGQSQYAPSTERGQRLLAHELTHVVQQRAAGTEAQGARRAAPSGAVPPTAKPGPSLSTGLLQRDITVEPTPDARDPAHTMSARQRRDIVRPLVQQLCPDFDVSSGSPMRVQPQGTVCQDLQSSTRELHSGCCCLCVLTAPGAAHWQIVVSQNDSPNTDPGTRTVTINPSGSPVESMHWTDATGAGQRIVDRPRVITFGHELCGHAALMEIDSHPAAADRRTTNVHDPTIKIERDIWSEQGLPVGDRRGLAAGGSHRGESVYRVVLDRFPLNASAISTLPPSEQADLAELKRFSSRFGWFIEVHGHSDHRGSSAAKQAVSDRRAAAVRADLGSASNSANYTFVAETGHSDNQPIPGATAAQLRRVEVILSIFRAGVPTAPPAAAVNPVAPDNPAQHARNLRSANLCVRHLATRAWT